MNPPASIPAPDESPSLRPPAETARPAPASICDELASALAHEINQPLAAILGNAQAARRFLRGDGISRDEMLAILDDIIRDTQRAGEIIRNLQKPPPENAPQSIPPL